MIKFTRLDEQTSAALSQFNEDLNLHVETINAVLKSLKIIPKKELTEVFDQYSRAMDRFGKEKVVKLYNEHATQLQESVELTEGEKEADLVRKELRDLEKSVGTLLAVLKDNFKGNHDKELMGLKQAVLQAHKYVLNSVDPEDKKKLH